MPGAWPESSRPARQPPRGTLHRKLGAVVRLPATRLLGCLHRRDGRSFRAMKGASGTPYLGAGHRATQTFSPIAAHETQAAPAPLSVTQSVS